MDTVIINLTGREVRLGGKDIPVHGKASLEGEPFPYPFEALEYLTERLGVRVVASFRPKKAKVAVEVGDLPEVPDGAGVFVLVPSEVFDYGQLGQVTQAVEERVGDKPAFIACAYPYIGCIVVSPYTACTIEEVITYEEDEGKEEEG